MLFLIPLISSIVFAGAVTGDIRVLPLLPVKFQTPVHFSVETIGDDPVAYNPIIFLAMTKESYDALTDGVDVVWGGGSISFAKANFLEENNNEAELPSDTAGYTVASLKGYLETSGPIYWVSGSFLGGEITRSPKEFTVTLHSTAPNMLVYALGKSSPVADQYDMKTVQKFPADPVPRFHVPEPATILGLMASMMAFAGYAIKKRKWG